MFNITLLFSPFLIIIFVIICIIILQILHNQRKDEVKYTLINDPTPIDDYCPKVDNDVCLNDIVYYNPDSYKDNISTRTITPSELKEYKNKKQTKGERECCRAMEELTGKRFYTVRPDWLKNPETNRNLELDCFNPELGIAVEYNGEQHYKYPNAFHKSEREFINQIRRDEFKREQCDKNGIYLITVPYTIKINEIKEYLKNELKNINM